MNNRRQPLLAVTLGDPAGVGPEITARTLADPALAGVGRGIAVGDVTALRRAVAVCGLDVDIHPVSSISEAKHARGTIDILDVDVAGDDLEWGLVEPGRRTIGGGCDRGSDAGCTGRRR